MTGKALSFYLGGKMFGLNIQLVKEISRRVEYSQVPDADPNIVGLMNLRGQVVTLFDLGRILGLPAPEDERHQSACIILKAQSNSANQIGFLIDKPGDVLDIQQEWCEPPPANVEEVNGKYIREVVKLDEDLLMLLEPDQVFE